MARKPKKIEPSRVLQDEIWTQRDGTPILVSDMSEMHAKNALRKVLRNRRREQNAAPDQAIEDSVDLLYFHPEN